MSLCTGRYNSDLVFFHITVRIKPDLSLVRAYSCQRPVRGRSRRRTSDKLYGVSFWLNHLSECSFLRKNHLLDCFMWWKISVFHMLQKLFRIAKNIIYLPSWYELELPEAGGKVLRVWPTRKWTEVKRTGLDNQVIWRTRSEDLSSLGFG